MARYKFDGTRLKSGGSTIANVRGDRICRGSGSTTICNIRDELESVKKDVLKLIYKMGD